ncbi:hypothetical protein MHU86_14832 [Fragilaria crotonensis]|nr:hypothetical protein MHU86_14832 [Fragilaria crotonensis]
MFTQLNRLYTDAPSFLTVPMPGPTIPSQDGVTAVSVPTSLLVIGAAMSRTGTYSTMLALERLGHKVFHGMHFASHSRWPTLFSALAVAEREGRNSDSAVQAIVDALSQYGFTATVDFPMAAIWQDLYRHFPNATVLLTHRDDDVEAWARSCIWVGFRLGYYFSQPPLRWIPPFSNMVAMEGWMLTHRMGVPKEEYSQSRPTLISLETAVKMYHRYQDTVKSTVDREKLIVFNVKQGWDPLCSLAVPGVECPDSRNEPFPHVNQMSGGQARRIADILGVIAYTWPLLLIGILGINFWLVRPVFRRAVVTKENRRKKKAA